MQKIEELKDWRESDLFDPRERAALEHTEAVTRSDQTMQEGVFDVLKDFFNEDAIVELTGLIAFQNMSSKFNSALGIPAQGFCRLPNQ